MNKKIAKIDFSIDSKKYKLISITRESNGGFYIIYPMRIGKVYKYSKFTYHSDGRCHVKTYKEVKGNEEGVGLRFPKNIPINKIKKITSTNFFVSLKDFENILFKGVSFSDSEERKGYYFYKILKSENYKNLTIRFFLFPKDVKTNKPTKKYKKVFRISLDDDIDLVITIEDSWINDVKK